VDLSARLALHLLGPPGLELNNAPIIADRRKTLALLAYLAVNRWQHHRDHISTLLWPDYDQSRAYTNLRHILWEVQQAIGEGWVVANRDTIRLIADDDHSSSEPGRVVWMDVARFKSLITQSRAHTQRDVSLRISLLSDAVKLYRNHFLTGFGLKHSPNFNEWAVAESDDLRHQLASVLTILSEDHCSLGQSEIAIPYGRRLIALDPLNEASHRQLMQVYIQAGQNNAALKQYQICEQILRKELGVDPQPETRALYKQIRKGEVKATQPVTQKEMSAPPHNLPYQISTFIGRERELDDIANLIANNRLVTLVGTGGIGKTRLSLKVAEGLLRDFANGIWFVELAPLNDSTGVPQTVASLFGLIEGSSESPNEKLIRFLRSKTVLLILDNCEHLLDACAQLADTLLKNCPNLKILTTSREPLGITGEAQYHVPSLALPDLQQILERLLDFASIQLFEGRARLVQENFSLTMDNASSIVQICHRLDGIPLAIELAAARINTFSTEQIAARLDESFNLLTGGSRTALPRQQTLAGSIDWSWKLLSESEQTLMRRLAIFAGGWTLDAAEKVGAGDRVNELDVLNLLDNLVEKSLVLVDAENGRYRMLETIRQFAYEKFQESGEVEAVRNCHCAWVLAWSEEIKQELKGRDQVVRLRQVAVELDNVRTAVEWGFGSGHAEISMRIVIALRSFWDGRSHYQESHQWLEKGISLREHMSKKILAKVLSEAAWLTYRQNDPAAGIAYAEESLILAEGLEDPPLIADALCSMGVIHTAKGDSVEATHCLEKAGLLYQKLGDKDGLATVVGNLAIVLLYQGKIKDAIELLEGHLNLLDDLDDFSTSAWYQFFLGGCKVLQGELEPATVLLSNGLRLFRQINNVYFIGYCLIPFAGAANGYNNPMRASRLFGAREVIHESIGAKLDPGLQRINISLIAQARAMLDESAFATAWAEGRAMTIEQAIEYALHDTGEESSRIRNNFPIFIVAVLFMNLEGLMQLWQSCGDLLQTILPFANFTRIC
jgi:non-specific serine/threonine protein kinase